jgi:hypothetical protein
MFLHAQFSIIEKQRKNCLLIQQLILGNNAPGIKTLNSAHKDDQEFFFFFLFNHLAVLQLPGSMRK